MIKETADKDSLVFIFIRHIISLKLTYQKGDHVFSPYNGNNYYISKNL